MKQLQSDHTGVARNRWNTFWRRLIWKIYVVDLIVCTNCGTEMRIRKVITTGADREIRKLTDLQYYISGRWSKPITYPVLALTLGCSIRQCIEKRKKYSGPLDGKEKRYKAA